MIVVELIDLILSTSTIEDSIGSFIWVSWIVPKICKDFVFFGRL